jgi:hypothetical protein
MKLRGVVYNILNFKEFPKIIVRKSHPGHEECNLCKGGQLILRKQAKTHQERA